MYIIFSKDGSNFIPTRTIRVCYLHFVNNKKYNDPRSLSFHPTIFSLNRQPLIYNNSESEKKMMNKL